MLVPRKLEEVVIAVPLQLYDRVVAALASEGIFHVDEPPNKLPGSLERKYRVAYSQASEKLSRIRQYFALAGIEPYTVKGLELQVGSWIGSFEEHVKANSNLEEFYDNLFKKYTEIETEIRVLSEAKKLIEPFYKIEGDIASAYKVEVLDFIVGFTDELEVIEVIEKETLKQGGVIAVEEGVSGVLLFAIAVPKGKGRALTSLASRLGATIYIPPEDLPGSPSEALKEIDARIKSLEDQLESIRERASSRISELARYYTVLNAFASVFKLLSLTLRTDTLAIIRGFVDVKDSRKLITIVERASLGAYTVLSLGIKRGEERIPSKVDLPGFLKPFHRIVEIYGHPQPDEIVPTVFLAVTMPLTFALMFPDAGHGLLVVLFALLYVSKISRDWAYVIGVMGAASVISGLLAGEVFGPIVSELLGISKLWKELGWEVPPYALPTYAVTHGEEELGPALSMRVINVSVIIGAFMLSFGTFLGVVNSLIKKDWEDLIERSLPRFLIFASVAAPFLVYLDAREGGRILGKAILEAGGGDPFATVVIGGFVLGVVWMAAAGPIIALKEGHSPLSALFNSLLELYESILMVIGNLPSFFRIMALAMVHSSLTLAVAIISEIIAEAVLGGVLLAIIIYVLGNLAIAGLEGLLAFAHATRLHFYEWFSKFYTGGGIPYTPLRLEGVTIRVP